MDKKILFGPIWCKLYHFGFFKWRYVATKVFIKEDRLIAKFLGFIKVRDIPLSHIKEAIILDKKWTNKIVSGTTLSFNLLNNPLRITYNHNSRDKVDYIVTHIDHKKRLAEIINSQNTV